LYFGLYCFAFIYLSFCWTDGFGILVVGVLLITFTIVTLRFYGSEELRYTVAALTVVTIVMQVAASFPYEQAIHTRVGIYYVNLIPHVIIQAYSYGKILRKEYKMEILPLISSFVTTISTISACAATPVPSENQVIEIISSLEWQWFWTVFGVVLNGKNVAQLCRLLRAEWAYWFGG
jgi:hypothetical protein